MFTESGHGVEYGNCINANALLLLQGRQQCETGLLQQEYAGLAFLASFAREVGTSLNPREVTLAAAKLLYNYFHYDLAVFSLCTDSGGVTAFSPLDAAGCMGVFLMARENFPDLKAKEINDYRHLGLSSPGQAKISDNYPTVIEIAGNGIKITLYCGDDAEGKATHDLLTGIAESLTTALRNAREHDRVKELSVRDGLTGLYNRRVLEEILGVEESKRTPAPLAILILDVDDFKAINDTFGHPAGDRVLSVLGKLLQDNCRRENIVARYGGEEFAVLLTNTGLTAAAAMQAAERLRKVLAAQDFAFSGRKVKLTVSIGVAYSTGKTAAPKTILERADQALYKAKRSGKNRVCLHEANHIQLCPDKDLNVRAVR
jgi:diguanylate cyclase (GGDEF)-like protein